MTASGSSFSLKSYQIRGILRARRQGRTEDFSETRDGLMEAYERRINNFTNCSVLGPATRPESTDRLGGASALMPRMAAHAFQVGLRIHHAARHGGLSSNSYAAQNGRAAQKAVAR